MRLARNTSGQLIRYADSPAYDSVTGAPVQYGEDRSDPRQWDQNTGSRLGLVVRVPSANAYEPERLIPIPGAMNVADIKAILRNNGVMNAIVSTSNGIQLSDSASLAGHTELIARPTFKDRGNIAA